MIRKDQHQAKPERKKTVGMNSISSVLAEWTGSFAVVSHSHKQKKSNDPSQFLTGAQGPELRSYPKVLISTS